MAKLLCWNCGHDLADVPRPISRHATCAECFSELHCCRLCRHYDTRMTGHCSEERADPPVYKENANFCEFYAPRGGAFDDVRSRKSDSARARLEGLFDTPGAGESDEEAADDATGSAPETPEDAARRKLDDLFRKDD